MKIYLEALDLTLENGKKIKKKSENSQNILISVEARFKNFTIKK